MSINITISVIIPLYNKSYSITRCLNSVFNQTVAPNEIIIVNDGSTDDGFQIVEEYVKGQSIRCVLIDQKNSGVSCARNLGVSNSNSTFVAFLDADDEWTASYIERRIASIFKFPMAKVYSGGHILSNDKLGCRNGPNPLNTNFHGYVKNFFITSCKGSLANSSKTIIDRVAFIEAGGFPEGITIGEDLFLWIQLGLIHSFVYDSRRDVIIHYELDNSRCNRNNNVPYPLEYYSTNELPKIVRPYIFRIFYKHFFAAIKSGNIKCALCIFIKSYKHFF